MAPGDDDARHRREEAERKAKRKHAKTNKSEAQKEKERKRKEHALKILQQHGGDGRKKAKPSPPAEEAKSLFQEIFANRSQGFQIDFRFRNAPPRPPVGPCFVGSGVSGVLMDASKYKPLNSVEVNYHWKLHSEPDLGVPLAPSAVDPASYVSDTARRQPKLHPDDEALLNWQGSMGDTAAEELKRRRERARASARLALLGKSPAKTSSPTRAPVSSAAGPSQPKKAFSRVLDETMQSWMKKTTYLTNDYSRKVHDFKSLAQTKQELAEDLGKMQQDILKLRSPEAVANTFVQNTMPVGSHPTKKGLKPVSIMPVLPNVGHWGQAYTHVIIDKSPNVGTEKTQHAFIANVQKKDSNARMTCQLFIPPDDSMRYQAIQQYDLDVIPLKEEDVPHMNFTIWIDPDRKSASFLPISSRVQLSTGRPLSKKKFYMDITRRERTRTEFLEQEEAMAEVDPLSHKTSQRDQGKRQVAMQRIDSDEDSDNEESFVNAGGTFVAE